MFNWINFQAICARQCHQFEGVRWCQQVLEFLTNDENFKGSVIDDEKHQANLQNSNFIPKGVKTLEGIFDFLTNDETFKELVIDDEEYQANIQSGNCILKG